MERADKALLAAAVGIAVYDLLYPDETISSRINEYQESRVGKWVTRAAIGYMALHLTGTCPERLDFLTIAADKLVRDRKK